MFLGLRTAIYRVDDPATGKAWYSKVLGQQPYFDEPFYVGFEVGGFELGLDPNAPAAGAGGVRTYWGVEDIADAHRRLIEAGASEHQTIQDVGEGIKVATVLDPFGNLLGIIENPLFKRDKVR